MNTASTKPQPNPPGSSYDRAAIATKAVELHRQELARMAEAVTPRPEQLRSMTAAALRDEIARMWDRLGHTGQN